jgi:cystathionine beta-synthase
MRVYDNVLQAIGHTPLIRLNKVIDDMPVNMLAKVEYLNPGGSVKDRIGLSMIEDAEQRGILKPGGTIIEATAGNTGAGLALVAAVKGYRCVFVMPDKMSEDKINLLKAYGAEVVVTPTNVPPDSPESYNGVADRLAREIQGAIRPNQFGNQKNPEAHYRTTGPEIWEATEGKLDVFVCGMGTGGSISGVGLYLKEKNPNIVVIGVDPEGSILSGDSPKSWKVEGIGEDFIPATFNRQVVDEMVRVSDAESFWMTRRIAREEGLLVGGSSGTAVAGALKYARRLPPGKTVVVLLPDSGRNYLTKLFSDRWMEEQGLLDYTPEHFTVGDVLVRMKEGRQHLISIGPDEPVSRAIELLDQYQISQLPVIQDGAVVGTLGEVTLAKILHDGLDPRGQKVRDVMAKPLPQVDANTDLSEPYRLMLAGHGGVIVTRNGKAEGFLARIDLVNFWNSKRRTSTPSPLLRGEGRGKG